MSTSNSMDGVAVVTGAGAGIGAGIAQEAARHGMTVIVSDIKADRAQEITARITAAGGKAYADTTDVRDPAAIKSLAASVHKKFGDVRLLVNNAGIDILGPSWELTADQWADVIATNLSGVVHGVQAFLPRMLEVGKTGTRSAIANVSSLGALGTMALHSAYFSSKHAVLGYTECLYLEMDFLKAPIDISAIVPGPVRSRLYEEPRLSAGSLTKVTEAYRRLTMESIAANGMNADAAAAQIFRQLLERDFWVSTDVAMTEYMTATRAEHLRLRLRPQFPGPMRDTLARLAEEV